MLLFCFNVKQIDECNRLWVMDSGKIGESQVCPPQLLAFDLMTDQPVFRHVVNASNYLHSSLFITPVSIAIVLELAERVANNIFTLCLQHTLCLRYSILYDFKHIFSQRLKQFSDFVTIYFSVDETGLPTRHP